MPEVYDVVVSQNRAPNSLREENPRLYNRRPVVVQHGGASDEPFAVIGTNQSRVREPRRIYSKASGNIPRPRLSSRLQSIDVYQRVSTPPDYESLGFEDSPATLKEQEGNPKHGLSQHADLVEERRGVEERIRNVTEARERALEKMTRVQEEMTREQEEMKKVREKMTKEHEEMARDEEEMNKRVRERERARSENAKRQQEMERSQKEVHYLLDNAETRFEGSFIESGERHAASKRASSEPRDFTEEKRLHVGKRIKVGEGSEQQDDREPWARPMATSASRSRRQSYYEGAPLKAYYDPTYHYEPRGPPPSQSAYTNQRLYPYMGHTGSNAGFYPPAATTIQPASIHTRPEQPSTRRRNKWKREQDERAIEMEQAGKEHHEWAQREMMSRERMREPQCDVVFGMPGNASNQRARQATCEDYDPNEDTTIPVTPEIANQTIKSGPRNGANIGPDTSYDSGYSSWTASTMSSYDSTRSLQDQPPRNETNKEKAVVQHKPMAFTRSRHEEEATSAEVQALQLCIQLLKEGKVIESHQIQKLITAFQENKEKALKIRWGERTLYERMAEIQQNKSKLDAPIPFSSDPRVISLSDEDNTVLPAASEPRQNNHNSEDSSQRKESESSFPDNPILSAAERSGEESALPLQQDADNESGPRDYGVQKTVEHGMSDFLEDRSPKGPKYLAMNGNDLEAIDEAMKDKRHKEFILNLVHEFERNTLRSMDQYDASTGTNYARRGDYSDTAMVVGDHSKIRLLLGDYSQIKLTTGDYSNTTFDGGDYSEIKLRLGGHSRISFPNPEHPKRFRLGFSDVAMLVHYALRWRSAAARRRSTEATLFEREQDPTTLHSVHGTRRLASKEEISDKALEIQESQPGRLVRLKWICICGQSFEEVMHELVPGAVQELASELSTPECSDISLSQLSSSASSSSETVPTSAGSAARSRHPYQDSEDVAIDIDGVADGISDAGSSGIQKFILLCLASKGKENLEHADMSSAKTDRCMYTELHRCYFTPMRRLMRLLTLRTLDRIEFTRFQLYTRDGVAIEAGDVGGLPPDTARDYEYERKHPYRPLIPLTALKHWTENPSHVRSRPLHLKRVPTKISGKLRWSEDDGGEIEGWGLRFKEMISWKAVWVSEFFIASIATAFAVFWCSSHNGDLQDGFTVAGVVLAYGTIFLGLVQGFAQYLERNP